MGMGCLADRPPTGQDLPCFLKSFMRFRKQMGIVHNSVVVNDSQREKYMLLKITSYHKPEILLLEIAGIASARIFLILRERKKMKCS